MSVVSNTTCHVHTRTRQHHRTSTGVHQQRRKCMTCWYGIEHSHNIFFDLRSSSNPESNMYRGESSQLVYKYFKKCFILTLIFFPLSSSPHLKYRFRIASFVSNSSKVQARGAFQPSASGTFLMTHGMPLASSVRAKKSGSNVLASKMSGREGGCGTPGNRRAS